MAPMATVCRLGSRIALFGLLAALISGCSQEASLPRVLRVAKGSTNPGSLDIEESVRDRRAIWTRFEQEGISIPFPQRQIYPMQWPPNPQQSLKATEEVGSEQTPPPPQQGNNPNWHDP